MLIYHLMLYNTWSPRRGRYLYRIKGGYISQCLIRLHTAIVSKCEWNVSSILSNKIQIWQKSVFTWVAECEVRLNSLSFSNKICSKLSNDPIILSTWLYVCLKMTMKMIGFSGAIWFPMKLRESQFVCAFQFRDPIDVLLCVYRCFRVLCISVLC